MKQREAVYILNRIRIYHSKYFSASEISTSHTADWASAHRRKLFGGAVREDKKKVTDVQRRYAQLWT